MKKLQNNSSNYLTFVKSGENFGDIAGVLFRQLGSNIEIPIAALSVYADCYTEIIAITLEENKLVNANYVMKVMDGSGNVIITANALVSGNIGQDNYTILEQSSISDTIGNLPVQVIFDTFDNTFDNTFG